MPVFSYPIPAAVNTLDDLPFDDGHPVSSWALREVVHNDRAIHAYHRRCLTAHAWDLTSPFTQTALYWVRVAYWEGRTSPDQDTVTVSMRGIVTNGRIMAVAINTRARRRQEQHENLANWGVWVGNGAVQNVEFAGIEVLPGTWETIEVLTASGLQGSVSADVTGTVETIENNAIVVDAGGFAGVTTGFALRIEEPASNEPLTDWRQIVRVNANDKRTVYPAFGEHDQGLEEVGSAATVWRARPVAQMQLRSLSIDEDELTGNLGL